MIELKDLLGSLTEKLLGEEIKIDLFIRAVKDTTGIDISKKDIKIKKGVAFLSIKPIYKNEVLFKKEKILSKTRELMGVKSPTDIY